MSNSIAEAAAVDPRRVERLRAKIRNQSVREMRSAGRFDISPTELDALVASRLDRLLAKLESAGQGQLPLFDAGQVATETKRQSCRKTRTLRITLRDRIVEILQTAGRDGRTREELARDLGGIKEGTVCSPVRFLLNDGIICEPYSRESSLGNQVAVLVLCSIARAA